MSWLNKYQTRASKCALCRIFQPTINGDQLKDYYMSYFSQSNEWSLQSFLKRLKDQPIHSGCVRILKYIQTRLHIHDCVCACGDYYIKFEELKDDCDEGDPLEGYPPIHFVRVDPTDCSVCKVFKEWADNNRDMTEFTNKEKVLEYIDECGPFVWSTKLEDGDPINPACTEHIEFTLETLGLDKNYPGKTPISEPQSFTTP